MKGFWRALVLMLAPGFLWGAFFANGLLRIWDAPGEPLLWLLGAIALAGAITAWTAYLLRREPSRNPDLSVVDWLMCAALLIVPGALQRLGVPGPWIGLEEVLITAVGAAYVLHGFPTLSGADRNWRAIGMVLAALLFFSFIRINRMHFLEAMFFWSGELLLLAYLWASPATRRGTTKRRWRQRGAILLILLIAPAFRMDYLYAPWGGRPDAISESIAWLGTDVTAFGSYFRWGVPEDLESNALFDARNRMVQRYYSDRSLVPAIPGLLGIAGSHAPRILLAAAYDSFWISELADALPHGEIVLTQTIPWGTAAVAPDTRVKTLAAEKISPTECFRMLVILAVPEYPAFEGSLLRWLKRVTDAVDETHGIVAVPARLLASPTLMQYFHEHYAWHGVLPGAETMWVFANRPRDLSPGAIDNSLDELFGEESPLPRGMYELLYSNYAYRPDDAANCDLHLDSTHWHAFRGIAGSGGWRGWLWGGIALLVLWRLVRLFAERRGGGYRYWNLMENSFSVAAGSLAWMAYCISEYGAAPAATFCCALLPAAVFISGWRNYATWGILAALCVWSICRECALLPDGCVWMALFCVNAWIGGSYAGESLGTPECFRRELSAWGIGVLLAALAVGAAVFAEAPVEAVAGVILIARLPILRQMKLFSFNRK